MQATAREILSCTKHKVQQKCTCAATVCAGYSTHVIGLKEMLTRLGVVAVVVAVVVFLLWCWVCMLGIVLPEERPFRKNGQVLQKLSYWSCLACLEEQIEENRARREQSTTSLAEGCVKVCTDKEQICDWNTSFAYNTTSCAE